MNGLLPSRWMRVGSSDDPDGAVAARTAVEAALLGDRAALVLLFVSSRYDMEAVAKSASSAVDTTPMIGCSTAGEIGEGVAGSGRVVAAAIGGAGLRAQASVGMLEDGLADAGRAAAHGLMEISAPHRAVVLLSDGLSGGQTEVVRGAYGVGGAPVKLVGGRAADDLAMVKTWQILGDRVYTNAVVGATIGSNGPIGIGVGHGWRRVGEPMVVTKSDGHRIFRLDDRPALDLFLTRADAPPEAFEDLNAWQETTLLHQLGLPRPGGEEVRGVLGVDYKDRSLLCGDVPQGSVVWVMDGDAETVLDGTVTACDQALADLGDVPPVGLFAFDCAARRTILGDRLPDEMDTIAKHTGGVPVAGFYTYGEIARRRGSRGMNNSTLVMLALG
jgi:hypothetical protein